MVESPSVQVLSEDYLECILLLARFFFGICWGSEIRSCSLMNKERKFVLSPPMETGGTFGLLESDRLRVTSGQSFVYSVSKAKLYELDIPEDYSFLFT